MGLRITFASTFRRPASGGRRRAHAWEGAEAVLGSRCVRSSRVRSPRPIKPLLAPNFD